jgi:hypothetical protein
MGRVGWRAMTGRGGGRGRGQQVTIENTGLKHHTGLSCVTSKRWDVKMLFTLAWVAKEKRLNRGGLRREVRESGGGWDGGGPVRNTLDSGVANVRFYGRNSRAGGLAESCSRDAGMVDVVERDMWGPPLAVVSCRRVVWCGVVSCRVVSSLMGWKWGRNVNRWRGGGAALERMHQRNLAGFLGTNVNSFS